MNESKQYTAEDLARGEKAEALFRQGYNCAQAVLMTFEDVTGLPLELSAKIASSFGGGIGRLREFCGALSGAEMVLGLVLGYGTPESGNVKMEHYERVQALAKAFREEQGSWICRDQLHLEGAENPVPTPRTKAFYEERPCPRLVNTAAKAVSGMLREARKL